eukprot:TRINITY_DN16418_c0_g1_i1.p1 TRINITY_DN16418_c0_g1~~TRINITY_DN16418_c0_g1_i1.p1  ORF type:complete len:706 (-),score=84.21 TRINITY_DN16418_c0_g1_i1:65-2146(-)
MTDTDPADESSAAIIFSFVLNLTLFIGFWAIFEVLLRFPRFRQVLRPRSLAASTVRAELDGETQHVTSPSLEDQCWVRQVWSQRNNPTKLQPDAEVAVRFLEFGFKFTLFGSILDFALVPMYCSASGTANGWNRLGSANLRRDDSMRIWGVVVAAYVLTAAFAFLVSVEWKRFLRLRRNHFVSSVQGACGLAVAQARRSIIVEQVPPQAQRASKIQEFFDGMFGAGSVHSCFVIPDGVRFVDRLATAIPESLSNPLAATVEMMLPPLLPELSDPPGVAVAHEIGGGALGAVRLLHDVTVGRSSSSTAFVTLNSVSKSIEAQQVILSHDYEWIVFEAPEPRDIIWRNVFTPLPQIRSRLTLARLACVAGLLLWSLPVTMIQATVNIEYLQKWVSMEDLRTLSPVLYQFLTSYLPVLALMGLQMLLPLLFHFVAVKYEGHKTKSAVERIVLNRCFAYNLASLYVTVFAGSLWESLQQIVDSPKSVLDILSTTLPKGCVYFTTFVMARVGTGLPLILLRPWYFFWPASGGLQRCQYGAEFSNAALVLIVSLTYGFTAPAILPFCALYFGLASVSYRWLFSYAYEPEFDTGGAFFYDLFNSAFLGLLLGTLYLLGWASLAASPLQSASLVPLPLVTLRFGLYCWDHFGRASKFVPLQQAVEADREGTLRIPLSDDCYSRPFFAAFNESAVGFRRARD